MTMIPELKIITAPPQTIDEAVTRLMFILTERDKEKIRSISKENLLWLHLKLGTTIRKGFALNDGNIELMLDCNTIDKNECSMKIVEMVWETLNQSCPL
jgi:uncharacterized protein DUF6794